MADEKAVEIKIGHERFVEGFNALYSKWRDDEGAEHWGSSADAVVIVAGSQQEDVITFPKSLAIHAALFMLELSDTLIAFGNEKLYFLAASKKAKILEEMVSHLPDDFSHKVKVMTRDKSDKDKANFEEVISMIKDCKNGKKVGTLLKEKPSGAFASAWDEALKGSGLEIADVQNGIADVLATKTESQLEAVKAGGQLCTTSFKKHLLEKILDIVDQENAKFKMSDLSDRLENKTIGMHGELQMEKDDIEIVIPPIIQSGGKYDLKYTAQTSDEFLHLPDQGIPAIHVASLSVRYKFCFCNVARTLLFNAKREQSDNYKILFEAFDACLHELKPGLRLNKVFETATAKIKERNQRLLPNLHKELGWGMGYEVREKRLVLDEKNRHTLHAGMVLNLRIGLENLELKVKEPRSQKYSLLIADTVIITQDSYQVCTEGMSKKYGKLSWNVSDEQEEEQPKGKEKKAPTKEEIDKQINKKLGEKTRKMTEEEKEQQRKQFEERNKQLALDRVEEQRRRMHKDSDNDNVAGKQMSQVSGYKGPEDFPSKASGSQLYVDDSAQVVMVPINGVPCPFHVSTIKNASMQQQGAAGAILRINFVSPGSGMTLASMNKELMYLRELSYRAQEGQNLTMVHKQIHDMRKAFNAAEREKKARDEIVAQEPLTLNPNRGPRLQNLRIFPNILDRGKKTDGDLEAHVNGFRFTVKKAPSQDLKHIDVLYRNVKHAFFQPSNKNSNVILIHFRLKNSIMIGKQSAKDIQFYLEWLEDSESLLENKRRNNYDRDEIEDENRQKQMVAKLDGEFKKFCDKVQDILPPIDSTVPDGDKIWEWDIPYAELEFQGTPKNSMVELYPTVNCVVHLATKPVCIIELDNVDLVYYERLRAGNNNFDLAFVYKSFLDKDSKMPECWERISTIDSKYYDTVREVMQKSKMVQFEGQDQVNWNNVLKDYVKNFDDISADGGWNVIFGNDSDGEGEDEDEEEEDEDFEGDSDEDSDDGSDEDSDDSELSVVSEDDSDDVEEELSDDGMDSDEADAWAEQEDRRKALEDKEKALGKKGGLGDKDKKKRRKDDSDSEDDRRSKKKSKGPPPPAKGSKPKKGLGR